MAADPVILDGRDSGVLQDSTRAMDDSSVRQEADSGRVIVIERFARPRRRWVLQYGPESPSDVENLYAANRRKYTFLWVPPTTAENTQSEHWFASGDGVTSSFQLNARLGGTEDEDHNAIRGTSYDVFYPLPLTDPEVDISVNGTLLDQDTDYEMQDRGIVHFLGGPPAADAVIRASYTLAIPVRFFSESIELQMVTADGVEFIRQITIEEDFEDAED